MKAMALSILLVAATAVTGAAQDLVRVERDAECRWDHDGRRDNYCETREYGLDVRDRLEVDAGANGGIRVYGWDRDEIRVVARIEAWSRDDGDAQELAGEIEIRLGRVVEPDGPRTGRREGWAVTFEVSVPRSQMLRLEARNGGISLEDLTGDVDVRTRNGSIDYRGAGGWIRGSTRNGGVRVDLTGDTWHGEGLDLQTTNGGIRISVPEGFSAELETGTVNGGMRIDIPVMVQGRIDRTIHTELGSGGPLLRVITHNGGVVVTRR